MAQKVRVILLDDLINDDTTEADETVVFGLDGKTYEIDLTADNAHRLRARLKEFIQAGRQTKRATGRTKRPLTEPAGDGATYSRHQGGTDPAAARAWAIEQRLIPKDHRGRLAAKYKEAYRAFERNDTGPLGKLKAELERLLKAESTAAARERQRRPLRVPEPAQAEQPAEAKESEARPGSDEAKEAEANRHYSPLTVRDAISGDDKKWKRRTASGCNRTLKVEQMTLVERIEALTEFNLKVLGQMVGALPRNRKGQVTGLGTSDGRLQALEMIQYAPETEDGWTITDFGKYAYEVRSMG